MSTEEMLWVILQDRRRQAADAARERLARASRGGPAADPSEDGRVRVNGNRLRPVEGAQGR